MPTTVSQAGLEHPTAYDAQRVLGGRLVEDRGCRRAPVDQQDLVVLVAQAQPADVARVVVGEHVEPAEDETVVGGVQGGEPLAGLEHHRVALDEAALVAEPGAGVTVCGEGAGRGGGRLEPRVDAVDDRLLVLDLLLDHVIGDRS